MGWPAMPREVLAALTIAISLLAFASAFAWRIARQHPERQYAELKARIRTWWWIVGLFIVAILSSRAGGVAFFVLVSFLALREFVTLVPSRPEDRGMQILAFIAIPVQYYLAYIDWYGVFIIFIPVYMFLAIPARAVLTGHTTGFISAAATLQWGLMITTFSISHAAYLLALSPGIFPRVTPQWSSPAAAISPGLGFVTLLIALTELNDVAQYIWGKSFGRRRIAPHVSPNKTVAGFIGGVATTVVLAAAIGPRITPMNWRYSMLAGSIIALAGFMGDLSMSMVKRDLGVKDTGGMLPGHGGVLDRIDSLTFTAPLFFHFAYFNFF
jgi:phosphatidate cytidylyltransferase